MRRKACAAYEVLLYIGSKEGYNGPSFTKQDLLRELGLFQDTYPNALPVRVSECTYIAGSKYQEDGWEISAIMYPNHLRTKAEIDDYMEAVAKHLMETFKQNRISLQKVGEPPVWPPGFHNDDTVMFESERAETSRSIQEFNKTVS